MGGEGGGGEGVKGGEAVEGVCCVVERVDWRWLWVRGGGEGG